MTAPRHFLDLHEVDAATLRTILEDAKARKAARRGWPQGRPDADAPGAGRTLAMIFQKNSTRTRFSFDAGIRQLGGASIIATATDMQLGRGETIEDTARVLSRMVDAVMIRAISHEAIVDFAAASEVPLINGLTNQSHPCQIMADIMTYEEHRGPIAGRTVAWVGDGNNVCASFIHAAAKFDFDLVIACPDAYRPRAADLAHGAGRVRVTSDMAAAARGADCIVADGWVSMGDEDYQARVDAFAPFQVDEALMATAAPDAVFLHCLPAHRGEEVTAGVIDGPRSLVWDEAENRLHAQKSILAWCFGAIG
ncbi:MAG TPA: ornithine carbamoyltransferase [Caulobacteraceae bacterium]|jgi:ornithine carbamoyltransferase|nr:ornithine carbamoyltransferase [Caulobacteraceae bacterium]